MMSGPVMARFNRAGLVRPRARYLAFRGLFWLVVLTVLPQLVVVSAQVQLSFHVRSFTFKTIGLVPMLPYWAAMLGGLWWCARATNKRQLYLFSAYVLCGLASLANAQLLSGITEKVSIKLRNRQRANAAPNNKLRVIVQQYSSWHRMIA